MLSLPGMGKTPNDLADVVSSVIDVTQLYTINDFTTVTATVAAPVLGSNNMTFVAPAAGPAIVPAGEVWYIHGMNMTSNIAVGGSLRGMCGWRPFGTAFATILDEQVQAYIANDNVNAKCGFVGRFIPSGWGLSAFVTNIAAAAAINCTVIYSAFKG